MAQDTKPDIAGTPRHVYGPRPVGTLVPRITRPAFRRFSPAAAQIMADWPAIVGPALAAVTMPQRFSAGTLAIACAGPVAMELQHLAGELIGRINTHLGGTPVKTLRFLQTFTPAAARPPPAIARDPGCFTRQAEAALADLPPGPLRDALAGLGGAVLAAEAHTKNST